MTAPLDLCRARLLRAGEHIDSLGREIASLDATAIGNAPVIGRSLDQSPPARLCLMVGEIVYHLRAALDHIVWDLANRNGKFTKGQVTFPVCDNPEHFKQVVNNGILKGVPRKFYPQIASFQPYLTPDPPNAVLRLLDDLATIDLRDMANMILIPVAAEEASETGALKIDLAFTAIGSFENAPVLPVLGYLRGGVHTIAQAFEKHLRTNG